MKGTAMSTKSGLRIGIETVTTFSLRGRNLTVAFSFGATNPASLRFTDGDGLQVFTGDEISIERSALGTLVTVTTAQVADDSTTTFTLVLPEINFAEEPTHRVRVLGVVTVRRTTIAGPPSGQTSSSRAVQLSGRAEQFIGNTR
jgi:hypothetical protein